MKKTNHIIQYIVINFFFIIFKLIGYKASSKLGFFVGKYLWKRYMQQVNKHSR